MANTDLSPLDMILTPELLAQKRKMERQQLLQKLLAQSETGSERGMTATGFALGEALNKLHFGKAPADPEAEKAQANAVALKQAAQEASSISDPFERQIAQYTSLARAMNASGQYDVAGQLADKIGELRKQQFELSKLGSEAVSTGEKAKVDINPDYGLAAQAGAEVASKITGATKTQQEIEMLKPSTWWDPTKGKFIAIDEKNKDEILAAQARGAFPATPPGSAVTGSELGMPQPIAQDAREAVSFGLTGLDTYRAMEKLADRVPGLVDANGVPRPQALIEWAGGKIGIDQAASEWQVLEAKAHADIQSIIRGNPSNRDAQVFEALVPGFWEPTIVKKRRLAVLQSTQRKLIALNLAFYKGTKQQAPPELVEAAKARGVNVENIAAVDPTTYDQVLGSITDEAKQAIVETQDESDRAFLQRLRHSKATKVK